MKIMKLGAILSVAALAGCAGMTQNQRELTGTLAGGAAGAAVGSQFGSGSGRVAATAIGAVGGALAGREIAKQ